MASQEKVSKSAIQSDITSARIKAIAGIAIITIIIIITISVLTSESRTALAIFVLPFMFAIAESIRFIKSFFVANARVNRFKNYIDIITNKKITYIDKISHEVNRPIDEVMLDLQAMVDKQYFVDTYINPQTYTIEFGVQNRTQNKAADKPADKSTDSSTKVNNVKAAQENMIKCKYCGADNPATNTVCDYCGSSLKQRSK